jgi:hypothetical protein
MHICVNRIDPETYKARDPAHGWTKKALEKAARKIELAQGWEIERSGRYVVTTDGQILEKSNARDKVKLSQTARDIEAHTAAKSAERIAFETAAPIIRSAKNWEELHRTLAKKGIAFERKGSGAILRVGETVVKASCAGRDISFSKLEKRLGTYRERNCDILPRSPEPVERVKATPKVQDAWSNYQKEKANYHKVKNKTFAELRNRQRDERKAIFGSQRQVRSSLFAVSWKGRGAELNRCRSVMAAQQKSETLALRDRQRDERERLKKRFPRQFPSFKTWLSMDADPELSVIFRYPGQPAIFPAAVIEESSEIGKTLKPLDLRDYSPVSDIRRGGVMYVRAGGSVADFIDYGKKIVFSEEYDERSVLAALQLASQKWGAVQISGSDEYKRLCVELAAKHGIKVANSELRAELAALRGSGQQEEGYRRNKGWSR